MLIDIGYSSFAALTDQIKLGDSGYTYVVDESDELVAHPKLQLIYADQGRGGYDCRSAPDRRFDA